jgi:hypothetical protein
MDIVFVQFRRKHSKEKFSEKEYSFFADIPLNIGDLVYVPTKYGKGVAKVTKTDVQAYQVGCDLGLLKHITSFTEEETPDGEQQTLTDAAENTPCPLF